MIVIIVKDNNMCFHYPTGCDAYHDLQDYDLDRDDLPTRADFLSALERGGYIDICGVLDVYASTEGV